VDDLNIELFVFPDGTAVEMIVFDEPGSIEDAATPMRGMEERASPNVDRALPPLCAVPPAAHSLAAPTSAAADHTVTHACPACASALVYPIEWQRCSATSWRVVLRCPNCENRREVVLGRAAVEGFNRDHYHGEQTLTRLAERLSRSNFEEEAAKIIAALEHDLIQPMDF